MDNSFYLWATRSIMKDMRNSTIFFCIVLAAVIALGTFAPHTAFAADKDISAAVEEFKKEIADFQKEVALLRDAAAGGKPVPVASLQRFRDRVLALRDRVSDLKKRIPGSAVKAAPVTVEFKNTIGRGASGADVKELQEFLKQFPDVYPEGLEVGTFGPATERAIQRLQQKFGLEQTGSVGPKTGEKIAELNVAMNRKTHPKISAITPDQISIGTTVTLSGQGFTLEHNSLMVKGRIILKDMTSDEGATLMFTMPPAIPCVPDKSCPIKIVNKNGISNAKPFKLVESPRPPEEPPVQETPPPPPPPGPQINSISPGFGLIGSEVIMNGSGFTSTGNSINFGDVKNIISGINATASSTLKFNIPNTPSCQPISSCGISVANINGTSSAVSFTVTQNATPVMVASPNGGEVLLQGSTSTLRWSGGTDQVHIALVEESATKESDVSTLIIGWITTVGAPNGMLSWSAQEVCDVSGTACSPVVPGNYKLLAISENEFGNVVIGDNSNGNWDMSDSSFRIVPAPSITVVSPNGGEKLVYGNITSIVWDASSILSKSVIIQLLKGGNVYSVIASVVPQGTDTGRFIYSWTVPSTIPYGTDYAVRISDASRLALSDQSDGNFTVTPIPAITVLSPNGGEFWHSGEHLVGGFKSQIRWSSANIFSKAVHIKLNKGGTFYRTLAENVPQSYNGSSYTYTGGTFNYNLAIPTNLPEGNDYSIEVSDAGDSTVRDASDNQITIMPLPNPMTLSGRLVDKFTNAPLANNRFASYFFVYPPGIGINSTDGTTDTNGYFSQASTTHDMTFKRIIYTWPGCYPLWAPDIWKNTSTVNLNHFLFDMQPNTSTPLTQSNTNLGDIPLWPFARVNFVSDIPVSAKVEYMIPGSNIYEYNVWSGSGTGAPSTVWSVDALVALDLDVQLVLNNQYYAPYIKIPAQEGKCTPHTLTFLNNQFKWEPYNIIVTPYAFTSSAGYGALSLAMSSKTTLFASGGVAPYTWSVLYGSLPTGLTLDSVTGVVSGTPTIAGIYSFSIRTQDANGVSGARSYRVEVK